MTPYNRSYSFVHGPIPGIQINIELDNVELSVNETIDAVKDIRRSDGALKNGIVTVDSLAPPVAAMLGASADVDTIASNIGSIVAVAGIATEIDELYGVRDSIVSVGVVAGSVSVVAAASVSVVTVASNIGAINSVYNNIAAVQTAAANAQLAKDYASRAENSAVEPGLYSAFHWAKKAEGFAAVVDPTSYLRTDIAQTKTPAQKGQAIANIGGGVLAGFRNKIINGDFAINQRGTYLGSATGTLRFLSDRWSTAAVGSSAEIGSFPIPPADVAAASGGVNYHRVNVASVVGAANCVLVGQRIEGVRTLAGKKATVTFYAKADAAKPIAVEFIQSFGTGGSPSAQFNIAPQKVSLTASWQKFSLVFDIPPIASKTLGSGNNDFLGLQFWFDAGSSYNDRSGNLGQQSGSFDITHVSVVEGDATKEDDPFSSRHIQQELALCQRYAGVREVSGRFHADAANRIYEFPFTYQPMRAIPTATIVGAGTPGNLAAQFIERVSRSSATFSLRSVGAGDTYGIGYAYLFDAEL
ncbi:hypothetical protein [Neorhizobium sp. JUb45]|uniref:hypothetical protein n=1 Tax=Neorhizobium sp. JUb45 TaxID=2485113 RepID=UPI001045D210|nr:hypothetical protein [Neorhizobium sp. JUb45]TCR07364.1 hypothetical protein EDF70_1011338 [Neorhizobium sp. JUb45]